MSVIYTTDGALASYQLEEIAALASILSGQGTGNASLASILTAVQAINLDNDSEITVLNSILTALAGASTASNQTTGNSTLASILAAQATAAKQDTAKAVLDAILAALTGASTASKQDTGNTSLASIDTKLTSQATAANQATGNSTLSSIDSKMGSTTGTITSLNQTASSQVAMASNASRRGMYLYNNTAKKVYVAFAATTSVSAFTIILAANSGYESPQAAVYRGVVSIICEAAGAGTVLVTEMT